MTSRIRGLENNRNSCYADSVLMVLLRSFNPVIDKFILNRDISGLVTQTQTWTKCKETPKEDYELRILIQGELKKLKKYVQGDITIPNNCIQLLYLLNGCSNYNLRIGDYNDAGEFLSYLFNIFQLDIGRHSYTTYVSNDRINWVKVDSTVEDNNASPIISVYTLPDNIQYLSRLLIQVDEVSLDYENRFKYNDKYYTYKKKIDQYHIGNYLVFYIHRLSVVNNKEIIPEMRIGGLNLCGIVLYYSQHYTCYFCVNDIWYFYNDLVPYNVILIGGYDELFDSKYGCIKEHGVLYFYE